MKKFSRTIFGLLASAMLVAGSVSFVSCSGSDDDEEKTTQTVEVKTTTRTVTIGENTYTYTTVGGTVTTSESVVLNSDGTVTVSASDGSSVTFSADGTPITYTSADGKTYTGSTSTTGSDSDSIELTSESGETVSAEAKTETKTETVETPTADSADSGTVKELSFTDLEGKIFNYKDDGDDRWYKFEGGKVYKSSDKTYWNDKTSDWEEDGKSVALLNGTQYSVVDGKLPRTSGSGLYATFSETFTEDGESFTVSVTLKNDGTYTANDDDPEDTESGTFTNNNGLLAMTTAGDTWYGLYDGTSFYFVDKLLTEVTKTETKTTGGVSEATASVTELAYDSDTLNNKVFSYEDEDDGIRYLTFTDGKCYKSSSLDDLLNKEKDYLFISYNNKIYRSGKSTRSSGSGLFATFDDGYECKYTFKSDGTGIINFYDNSSLSFTFTNNAGLVAISFTYEGEADTFAMYYNGENIYAQKEELTFVKNYSAN